VTNNWFCKLYDETCHKNKLRTDRPLAKAKYRD
jgi:hypothetical protein